MMNLDTLGNMVKNSFVFKGSEKHPFLAPRGIFVADDKLFVSDTGQNRIFIWDSIPTAEFQEPDIILGQQGVNDYGRNSGGNPTANSLQYPSGIWSDGERIILADAWNHRVLIWHTLPKNNAQEADVVLGQSDFSSNLPNIKGIGSDPTAQTLNWPYGVFSDGKNLWIADTGNRRILYYNEIPVNSFTPADNVIGKPDFSTRDYNNEDPIWPYSIKINSKGQIAVADTQFFRILIWNDKNKAFDKPADIIIGQENFEACGQNQFRLSPEADTLNWCYDTCFYKDGILVNDTGNSRILCFNEIPKQNGEKADWLIGRPDFNTSSEYCNNIREIKNAIYWPFSIITNKNRLYIADTGNHRIIITELKT